jgi:hypothetical protein
MARLILLFIVVGPSLQAASFFGAACYVAAAYGVVFQGGRTQVRVVHVAHFPVRLVASTRPHDGGHHRRHEDLRSKD